MASNSISSTSIVNNNIISTPPNISRGNSNNNNNRFDNLINKYRTRGLDAVADFLTTKAKFVAMVGAKPWLASDKTLDGADMEAIKHAIPNIKMKEDNNGA
jgi:hypothetical protein